MAPRIITDEEGIAWEVTPAVCHSLGPSFGPEYAPVPTTRGWTMKFVCVAPGRAHGKQVYGKTQHDRLPELSDAELLTSLKLARTLELANG